MHAVRTAEFIPYTPRQMFELVNDVEAYPAFLPWCADARLDRRLPHGIIATLTVKKGPLHHSFTTENRNVEHERIEMSLLEGPFKRLHGVWHFDAAPGGCHVSLNLEFEFKSRLLSNALAKIFGGLTGSMVTAFRDRARALYG